MFQGRLCAIILAGAIIAASTPQARAQDIAPRWSGFHLGLNAGYGWNKTPTTFTGDGTKGAGSTVLRCLFDYATCASAPSYNQPLESSGFTGGVQFGYDWAISPVWIAGLETDLQYSGVKGDSAITQPDQGGVTLGANLSQNLKWFGTLRARFGYLATERLLAFATGGFAYGETDMNASIAVTGATGWDLTAFNSPTLVCVAMTTCLAGSSSKVSVGWSAGAGVEVAAWRNVSVKIEYLHIDLGDQTVRLVAQSPSSGGGYVDVKFDNSYDIVRAGVNFRY